MQKQHLQKNVILNTYGNMIYFFFQWLLTLVIIHLAGFEDAGIYSLALSYANIFGFISRFGVRGFQISDTNHEFTDGSYVAARLITSLLAVLLFAVTIPFLQLPRYTVLCSWVLLLFKILESITDVFFGIYQKIESYQAIAVSNTIKGILTLLVFAGVIFIGGGILWASVGMTGIYLVAVLGYDIPVLLRNEMVSKKAYKIEITTIIRHCVPLMLYTLINPFMFFYNRYGVEKLFAENVVGYYASFSLVITIVSTLAISIWAVIIPAVSKMYHSRQFTQLKKAILLILALMSAITIIGCLMGSWIGEPLLALVFGKSILDYQYLLNPMIVIAMIITTVTFFNTLLITFRRNFQMLIGTTIGGIVCVVTTFPLTRMYGLLGASLSLGLGVATQLILLLACSWRVLIVEAKQKQDG